MLPKTPSCIPAQSLRRPGGCREWAPLGPLCSLPPKLLQVVSQPKPQ